MPRKNVKTLHHIAYLLTIILTILTLLHYSIINKNEFTLGDFFENPVQFAGQYRSITGPFVAQTKEGFFMELNKHHLLVHYAEPYSPPRLGEVSVYGRLNEDGSMTAWRIHNYDYNYLLYVLSFITGLFVIIYFLWEWKITSTGFKPRFRGDNHA